MVQACLSGLEPFGVLPDLRNTTEGLGGSIVKAVGGGRLSFESESLERNLLLREDKFDGESKEREEVTCESLVTGL